MLPIFGVGDKYDNDKKVVSNDVCKVASILYKVSIT